MQRQKLQQILRDLEEIYIGNLNTVEADLELPAVGRLGTQITWESDNTSFIDHDGRVNRPSFGVGNRKIHLTATGRQGREMAQRTFEVTVLKRPREIAIKRILPVQWQAMAGEDMVLPPVIIGQETSGGFLALAVKWPETKPLYPGEVRTIRGFVEEISAEAEAIIREMSPPSRQEPAAHENPAVLQETAPGSVRLQGDTFFTRAQDRMLTWLRQVSTDQLLYNFRDAAGILPEGSVPMTGWDAPECKLKGHTTGHALSGLALAYCATGDSFYKEKIHVLVSELKICQEKLQEKGWKEGFLSGYGEEQFDLLEEYTTYPSIWAPYYTLDKIMSGLCDCYEYAGEEMALEVVSAMGLWVWNRLKRLSRKQRDRMWAMYIAGEFGGIMGVLAKLCRITGDERFLEASGFFDNQKLFYPMGINRDTLKDMHANQHIPQIIGALEQYRAGGPESRKQMAENFWNMVTRHHCYTIGGTGETEMFHGADQLQEYLTERAAESCATYNMLRLTAGLHELTPSEDKMDYYENGLYNHLLSSMSHDCDGGTTYFMPLCPGGVKEFGTTENTCCHGTGLESRFRYQSHIYMTGVKENSLHVNLYIPSTYQREDLQVSLTEEDAHVFLLKVKTKNPLNLVLRKPRWVREMDVTWEEEALQKESSLRQENGFIYLSLPAGSKEYKLRLKLDHLWQLRPSVDNPDLVSITWGPYVLAEISQEKELRPVPDLEKMRQTGEYRFACGERCFMPLAAVDKEAYHVYFRR